MPLTPPDDDCHYWAEAIEDGDQFYYLVNDTILEISEYEFGKVVANPYRYYFSTALKLHKRIELANRPHENWSLERTCRPRPTAGISTDARLLKWVCLMAPTSITSRQ